MLSWSLKSINQAQWQYKAGPTATHAQDVDRQDGRQAQISCAFKIPVVEMFLLKYLLKIWMQSRSSPSIHMSVHWDFAIVVQTTFSSILSHFRLSCSNIQIHGWAMPYCLTSTCTKIPKCVKAITGVWHWWWIIALSFSGIWTRGTWTHLLSIYICWSLFKNGNYKY